jgi:hypothetical protein
MSANEMVKVIIASENEKLQKISTDFNRKKQNSLKVCFKENENNVQKFAVCLKNYQEKLK